MCNAVEFVWLRVHYLSDEIFPLVFSSQSGSLKSLNLCHIFRPDLFSREALFIGCPLLGSV